MVRVLVTYLIPLLVKFCADDGSSSEEGTVMPPPGAGLYNQDSNMIVMNPDYNDEDDELAGYNSDDYFFGRRQPAEFEEVKITFQFT